MLISFFAVISVPLVESPQNPGLFATYLVPSLFALPPALIILFVLWSFTYRKSEQPAWVLFAIATVVGSSRGTFLFLAGELLVPEVELPSISNRVITAVLTWNISLGSFAIINFLVMAPTERWRKLQQELADLDRSIGDSKQQLDWLVDRRVRGLEAEIRERFLEISEKFRNADGRAQENYQELANALREFARMGIRGKSQVLWQPPRTTPFFKAALGALKGNPLPVISSTAIYFLGYLINEIRVYGFTSGLVSTVVASALFALLVWATRKVFASFAHSTAALVLIPILQGLISAAVYQALLYERGEQYLLVTSITAAIWAFTSVFSAGWFALAREMFRTEITSLDNKRDLSRAKLEWLEVQLAAAEREMAKYLHGILQSRLMAHAIELEGPHDRNSGGAEISLERLEAIMAAPMDAYLNRTNSLIDEIASLQQRWEGFLEIDCSVEVGSDHELVDGTMQVIQEALSNALRHGKATKVSVLIRDSLNSRIIEVTDNGQGTQGPAGLGSAIFESISDGKWKLTFGRSGTRLELAIRSEKQIGDH